MVRMSAHPGPWRNEVTPYLTEIMDTYGLPWVREVVVCAAVQTGKTEFEYNCAGFMMDRHPAPMMFVMPDQEMARRVSIDRIRPMLEDTICLKELLTSNPDDLAKTRIMLKNGMTVYMSWASSPTLLAAMPICYVLFDEVDKYSAFSGKEADPLSLGQARTTTFRHTKKIAKVSTPTTEYKNIWPALLRCQEVRNYYVVCIDCGAYQIMVFDQIKYPEGVEPQRIRRKYLAKYECEHCGSMWTDAMRDMSARAGSWMAVKPVEKPQSVGFHLPGWNSTFVSLSDVAADFLEADKSAQVGDKGPLMHFYNSRRAEPYTDVQVERKEDSILALRDDRPRGLVPADVSCLTAAVDTQKNGFFYEIRAWGWGSDLESWQVREGYVGTFEALYKILFEDEYTDVSGETYIVNFAVIDSGGTSSDVKGVSRTAEVYEFCRQVRYIVPITAQQRKNRPWSLTKLDHFPGTSKPIPGGLQLYNLHVTHYKDFLSQKLQINPTDPGAWHLHSNTTEQYAQHMCVEYKDDKGLWQCPRGRRNDFWDCGVYNLASAEIYGVPFMQKEEEQSQKPKQPKKPKQERPRRW